MSGVWAGLALIAAIFAAGALTLTISYHANARRDATRRQYAADIHDVWGDGDWDDEDDQAITAEAQHGITQIETYLEEAADQ